MQFCGADALRNPEPGFYILGAKSYGRCGKTSSNASHAAAAADVCTLQKKRVFAENWDAKTGSWLLDDEKVPDILDTVSRFDEDVRQISDDKKTGLITLRVVWHDPETAARWANELVQAANARLRAQALADAERNVSYLQREIASTGVVTLQESLGKVLESEMQKLLLARGNEEFAFKIIDKATPPKKRYRPYRALVLLFSAFVGLLFASLAVYVKRQLK